MTPLETYQQRVDRLTQQKQELTSRLRSYSVREHSPEWNELKQELYRTKTLLMFAQIDLDNATSRPSFPPNMIKEGGDNVPLIIGYAFVASLLITFVIYLISNF